MYGDNLLAFKLKMPVEYESVDSIKDIIMMLEQCVKTAERQHAEDEKMENERMVKFKQSRKKTIKKITEAIESKEPKDSAKL